MGKWALQLRLVPSRFSGKRNGEYALAAGFSLKSGRWVSLADRSGFGSSVPAWKLSMTADASLLPLPGVDPRRFQLRAYLTGSWQFASAWKGEIRVTERYRNYEPSRLSLRGSIQFSIGPWLSVLRAEGVHCKDWAASAIWKEDIKALPFRPICVSAAFLSRTGTTASMFMNGMRRGISLFRPIPEKEFPCREWQDTNFAWANGL